MESVVFIRKVHVILDHPTYSLGLILNIPGNLIMDIDYFGFHYCNGNQVGVLNDLLVLSSVSVLFLPRLLSTRKDTFTDNTRDNG